MRYLLHLVAAASLLASAEGPAQAGDREPWADPALPLVVDAYELNAIDWQALLTDKRIAGFIHKASDGLPESYTCRASMAVTASPIARPCGANAR